MLIYRGRVLRFRGGKELESLRKAVAEKGLMPPQPGSKPISPDPGSQASPKQPPKKTVLSWVGKKLATAKYGYISAIMAATGGSLTGAAQLLPSKHIVQAAPANPSAESEPAQPMMSALGTPVAKPVVTPQQAKQALQEAKDLARQEGLTEVDLNQRLRDWGLTQELLTQIGMAILSSTSVINGLAGVTSGVRLGQPSMVIGALGLMANTLPLAFAQSMGPVGWMCMWFAMFNFAGANCPPYSKEQEMRKYDMSYFTQTGNWQKAFTSEAGAAKMLKEIGGALKFSAQDAGLVLSACGRTAKQAYLHLMGDRDVLYDPANKDKSWNELFPPPQLAPPNPNAEQRRLSAALLGTGGAMWAGAAMMPSGPVQVVVGPANQLAALSVFGGDFSGNWSLYTLGKEQKGWSRPAIMIGSVTNMAAGLATVLVPSISGPLGSLIFSLKMISCGVPGIALERMNKLAEKQQQQEALAKSTQAAAPAQTDGPVEGKAG